jgi:hypothetical protein
MNKFFKTLVEFLDWPSGSILGLFTLIVIGISVHAYVTHVELPSTVTEIYKFVVMTFAGSKAVKTVWGKHVTEEVPK